jgi:hypothetical protein
MIGEITLVAVLWQSCGSPVAVLLSMRAAATSRTLVTQMPSSAACEDTLLMQPRWHARCDAQHSSTVTRLGICDVGALSMVRDLLADGAVSDGAVPVHAGGIAAVLVALTAGFLASNGLLG